MARWSRRQFLASATAGTLAGCSLNPLASSPESEWSMPLHDAGNTNYNPLTSVFTVGEGPSEQWSTSLSEDDPQLALGKRLLFAGGRLYAFTTTGRGRVYVLLADGERTRTIDRLVPQAVADGRLYGLRFPAEDSSGSFRTVAVDAGSGKTAWVRSVASARLRVVDTTAYVASRQAVLALEASSGGRLWRYSPPGDVGRPPLIAVGGGTVVVSTERAAVGLDAASGERRWRFAPQQTDPPPRLVQPVVRGDTAYVLSGTEPTSTTRPRLWALARDTGNRRWSWEGKINFGAAAVTETLVSNGHLALDRTTGERLWRSDVSDVADAATRRVVATRNAIVVATGDVRGMPDGPGGLYAVDRQTGRRVWSQSVGTPVWGLIAVGDRLYARTTDGRVRAYG